MRYFPNFSVVSETTPKRQNPVLQQNYKEKIFRFDGNLTRLILISIKPDSKRRGPWAPSFCFVRYFVTSPPWAELASDHSFSKATQSRTGSILVQTS